MDNISFFAKKGELVALLGVNGAGKTTLLKCLCGILKPSGDILFNKKAINKMPSKEIAKIVTYFAQSPENIDINVFESVLLSRKPYIKKFFSARDYAIAQSIINTLNLNHLALKKFTTVSGGEAQKVRIAQLLAQESKILLIDEPLNNLDLKNQIEVMQLLKTLVSQKKLIAIMALHDINMALNYADRLLFLKDAKLLDFCSLDELNAKIISDVYGIELDILNQNGKKLCVPNY
ncbi:ABC transporter ATP-binding protein [Desulfurella sp.]|uniref:ABC transporter ATP-binding protein n=1 Tax=Desulfurella sp. TaxID=1962857 RepID=UPI0025B7F3B6|nr:ABC transporter ATP-binding protein [Desulfurella sp.]